MTLPAAPKPSEIYSARAVLAATPGAVAGLLEGAQRAAAGPHRTLIPVTQAVDFGPSLLAGENLVVTGWVDRETRTLVFVQSELRRVEGGPLVAAGTGVYRIITA
jgi:acyl-coenzyme A thioesterase PaaI-like protein